MIIAAIRSTPDCNASLNTPRLPVRYTKKLFSDTKSAAEPTLSSAAILFSCASLAGVPLISARLDSPKWFETRLPIRTSLAGINGKETLMQSYAFFRSQKRSATEFMQ